MFTTCKKCGYEEADDTNWKDLCEECLQDYHCWLEDKLNIGNDLPIEFLQEKKG